MYDFSKQKAMLEVTLELLKENNLSNISSLGGGTALAAYYWNHRYSTDIDIFIYGNENKTHLLKPSNWSDPIRDKSTSIIKRVDACSFEFCGWLPSLSRFTYIRTCCHSP